jgi:hypothetical protein
MEDWVVIRHFQRDYDYAIDRMDPLDRSIDREASKSIRVSFIVRLMRKS